jgi:hypothetical protein
MYSSYGISGGAIDVTNQYELVKVKLRKRESGTPKKLAGARFMIYTSYNPETDTGTQFVPKPGYVNSGYEPTGFLYESHNDGNFYIGYLPYIEKECHPYKCKGDRCLCGEYDDGYCLGDDIECNLQEVVTEHSVGYKRIWKDFE